MIKNDKVKVSILCITYNQENYIRQTLESFVKQKTNFNFEILIGDDNSTDKTVSIIKEFEKKYPNIIKPIFRKINIGISNNLFDILKKAKGKYITMCAGDDFFTNNNKLQIQSDFLDKNLKCSMCFHLTKVFFENGEEKDAIFPDIKIRNNFTTTELLKDNFMQANSVMYRKIDYTNLPKDIIPEDWYLHLYHAKFGKIGFINKIMSAYRKHKGSIWWEIYEDSDKVIEKHGIKQFNMYIELLKLFENNTEHIKIINNHIFNLLNHIHKVDKNNQNTNLFLNLVNKYPSQLIDFYDTRYKLLNDDLTNIILQESQIKQKNYITELTKIKLSKFYKLWRYYCSIKDIFIK